MGISLKEKLSTLSYDELESIVERGCQNNITIDSQAINILKKVLTKNETVTAGHDEIMNTTLDILDHIEMNQIYNPWN